MANIAFLFLMLFGWILSCSDDSQSIADLEVQEDLGHETSESSADLSEDEEDEIEPECSANKACEEGEICNLCLGVCVAIEQPKPCLIGGNQCFSDEYCDPCVRVCMPRKSICEPCLEHVECGAEQDKCIDMISAGGRFCSQACDSALDCPEGYECEAQLKQCVPASGQCDAPAACQEDSDCRGSSMICQRGRCVLGCESSVACPSGQICEQGRCVDGCPTRPCEPPYFCEESTGLCKAEGECVSSSDCSPTEPEYCDVETHRCLSGCMEDNDCLDATMECVDHQCQLKACDSARFCAFEQICDLSSGACVDAEGPYCESCDPNAEHPCGDDANKCMTLEDDQGNSKGDFCFVACSDDPANRCPQGYECVPLQDEDGNAQGEVCVRDCTFDPWQ